ncbi:MAG TPA: ATP-binding protein [Miltoncostaeaceae bacterium]|nr:ATP-binding protein [Miltoncostaeaceae bacterium]
MGPDTVTGGLTGVDADGRMESAITVPARLQSLAFVRSAIACVLDRDPWAVDESGRVLLAAGEAVCNAIEHGSTGDGVVAVRMVLEPPGATVEVVDEGRPDREPRIDLSAPTPPPHSLRGRGIAIMRALADDIRVERAGAGTRLTLAFARAADPSGPHGTPHRRAA